MWKLWIYFILLIIFALLLCPIFAKAQNYCNSCGEISKGYVLKCKIFKASDTDTLERWVKDFIENSLHNDYIIKNVDRTDFPQKIVVCYLEKEKNNE